MSNSEKRTQQEEKLQEIQNEIISTFIDAETLISLTEPYDVGMQTNKAVMIGHFLNHTGKRLIELTEQAGHIEKELKQESEAA